MCRTYVKYLCLELHPKTLKVSTKYAAIKARSHRRAERVSALTQLGGIGQRMIGSVKSRFSRLCSLFFSIIFNECSS